MLSPSQPSETDKKRVNRLFLRFTAFYGQLWRGQFKSEEFLEFMKTEWHCALQLIENEFIDEAIEKCLKTKEYPPTLPYFFDLCKTAKKIHESKNQQKEVWEKASPEVALMHLAKIKTLLQMNPK